MKQNAVPLIENSLVGSLFCLSQRKKSSDSSRSLRLHVLHSGYCRRIAEALLNVRIVPGSGMNMFLVLRYYKTSSLGQWQAKAVSLSNFRSP